MATGRTSRSDYLRNRSALKARKDKCGICLEAIDYQAGQYEDLAFQADHIIPVSKGGSNRLSNLRATHRKCNRSKSDNWFAPEQNDIHLREW